MRRKKVRMRLGEWELVIDEESDGTQERARLSVNRCVCIPLKSSSNAVVFPFAQTKTDCRQGCKRRRSPDWAGSHSEGVVFNEEVEDLPGEERERESVCAGTVVLRLRRGDGAGNEVIRE